MKQIREDIKHNNNIDLKIAAITKKAEEDIALLSKEKKDISDIDKANVSICDHMRLINPNKYKDMPDLGILDRLEILDRQFENDDKVINSKWDLSKVLVRLTSYTEIKSLFSKLLYPTGRLESEASVRLNANKNTPEGVVDDVCVWVLLTNDGIYEESGTFKIYDGTHPHIELKENMFTNPVYIDDIWKD